MADAVVVGRGPRLYLVSLPATGAEDLGTFDLRPAGAELRPADLPPGLVHAAERLDRTGRLAVADPNLRAALSTRLSRPAVPPTRSELREARAKVPQLDPTVERSYLLARARAALEQALRSPVEVLITLAREEERLERAVGREARAAEAFLTTPDSALAAYAEAWAEARAVLGRHQAALRAQVERTAERLLPNLSHLVGARVTARLLANAGSMAALGRIRGPRLQLLGSRRRPSAERGPRFGVLYRADRMDEVPPGRRGAYARSLASLAAIAARADATTRAEIWPGLLARRDRRIAQLSRRPP